MFMQIVRCSYSRVVMEVKMAHLGSGRTKCVHLTVGKLAVKRALGILRMRCDLEDLLRKFVLVNGAEDG
jgi:hypothetical protein